MKILLLFGIILFGIILFARHRSANRPSVKEEDTMPPSCSHKRTQHHYYENPDTGARVYIPVCSDCMVALPPATETLARFSPYILRQIRQKLEDQGYDTTALPHIPVEDTP